MQILFDPARQKNPVDVEHSLGPQVQSLSFADDPLVLVHRAVCLHWFDDSRQNNPVLVSHSLDPQVHLFAFFDIPLTTSHTGMTLHSSLWQNKPVESEQMLVPHMHADGFIKKPPSFTHAGPVQQPHERTIVHWPVFNAGPTIS